MDESLGVEDLFTIGVLLHGARQVAGCVFRCQYPLLVRQSGGTSGGALVDRVRAGRRVADNGEAGGGKPGDEESCELATHRSTGCRR